MHTHTCVYAYCMYTCRLSFICTIILALPLSWTRIHSPFQYTQVPLAPSARRAKKNFSFPSSRELFFKLVINFIYKTGAAIQKRKMAQFQACKCSPPCHISTSHIHFRCRHVYKISQVKQKHLLCFSNAALATLCGDFLNFRSSGSALGLRVHRCVRYNYWKLVPGRPVWYFLHNVSGGDLMHSCSEVKRHRRIRIKRHTHFIYTKSFTCAHPGLLTAA